MKVLALVLTAVVLGGCAINPLASKRQDVVNCTKGFMRYEAGVVDSSVACMRIYGIKQ